MGATISPMKLNALNKLTSLFLAVILSLSLAGCSFDVQTNTSTGYTPVDDSLTVRFIDVGQGDSALITCGTDSMIIDGGPKDSSEKVYSILSRLNLNKINYIVGTHTDSDHFSGLCAALSYATCDTFYCSEDACDTDTCTKVKSKLEAQGKSITIPSTGDSFKLGDATVTFIGPVKDFADDDNNGSLVLRIDHGSKSFLFMADAEKEAENAMIKAGSNVKADVLKVGHHGSKSSSTDKFLQAVNPSIAVISVGANNKYGHPSDRVLQSLQGLGVNIRQTDELGNIVLKSDGSNASVSSTKSDIVE